MFIEYNLILEIKYRTIVEQQKLSFKQFVEQQQDRKKKKK